MSPRKAEVPAMSSWLKSLKSRKPNGQGRQSLKYKCLGPYHDATNEQ